MADGDSLPITEETPPHSDAGLEEVIGQLRQLRQLGEAAIPPLPQRIGRYRVERLLGRGGFGMVFLAQDEQLNRSVAVKVPHAEPISQPVDAEAYLAEARTVAKLRHPAIVPVFDVGRTDEFPCYIVSEFIEGTDLAKRIKQSRLSYFEAAELVAVVAEALHFAHKQGVVHRDVKPGNILIGTDSKPYVVDFGLALREENLGKGLGNAGTPAYMSPEQARGEGHRVDGRCDIFSLGVVFYELLVGRRPFRADTVPELREQIISHEPRPLRQYDDSISKELERICLKMLSKRASDRYTTASDVADDLKHFLQQSPGEVVSSRVVIAPYQETPAGTNVTDDTPAATSTPDSQPIKIVPKGLRSFDEHDADFFLELLPGPRDREGLPDSIRFWKTRIEETDADKTFSVGLIYGPSGCGKTSLVKAGLLPRLSKNVICIYVEATPEETESRLLHGLHKQCPALDEHLSLKDTLAALRRGQGISVGKKVLIVLDQFEQWLHAKKEEENSELVQALRQCDGGHVQCIMMVRDDFWLAVSRFMQELEFRLLEGQNSALIDLFPIRHAEKVLAAFGRAFGVLSDDVGKLTKDQKQFVEKAAHSLAEDGKVVCVRLALFAEMMKGKPWSPATLKEVGGTQGLGVTFLEETFSASTAPPEHRHHQKAARAVLKALLPESGTDIKGNMRSYDELLETSSYAPPEFAHLIRMLDSEIRLITPTDPEGAVAAEQRIAAPAGAATKKYYQLTHDYLVPSLRDWLTRKQKETRRGRAELRLAERSALWNAKPENRHLPSLWEFLNIRLLTERKNWTEPQQKMMGKAGRVQAMRSGLAAVLLVAVLLAAREITGRFQAASLVEQLVSADIAQVPAIVERLDPYRSWANPLLRQKNETAERSSIQKLHSALALLPVDAFQVDDLRKQLVLVAPSRFPVVRDALVPHNDDVTEPLWKTALDSELPTDERFQAACALATYTPVDERWKQIEMLVASHLVSRQASEFLAWREALRPAKVQLLKPLASICRGPAQERQYRIYASETLADYAADRPDDLFNLLADAERYQFQVLFGKLTGHKREAIALARQELEKQPGEKASEDGKEALAKRQANAAVALYRMGEYAAVWPRLTFSPDPRVRSYIIHWLSPLGGSPQAIFQQFDNESDVTIRRALLLTLGEFTDTQLPEAERNPLIEKLLAVFENEPDAGLHGAAQWLLHKWGQGERLRSVVNELQSTEEQLQARKATEKRQWYVNTQGQTFVIVDAGESEMGSPRSEPGHTNAEIQQRRRIARRFAIATTEVTRKAASRGPSLVVPDSNVVKTSDSPETGFTWYDAAQYCNWLSQQEGIAEDQWCYKENEEGKYASGMKAKANFLDLQGYRLPMEWEWEYACRAGTATSRYFGSTETLLPQYAWYFGNAQYGLRPVGSLKPNDLGLFDMLGNAYEWCHDRFFGFSLPSSTAGEDVIGKADNDRRVLRGGAFDSHPGHVRSAHRTTGRPGDRVDVTGYGFRPARTYP